MRPSGRPSGRGALGGVLAALLVALAAACGSDDPTGPTFEVIEEVEFAAALGIDLALMTEKDSTGIYFQDLVAGVGDTAIVGDTLFIQFTGWLRDGLQFDTGDFSYIFGNAATAIPGMHLGMQGQQVGGTRLMIIPSGWAYGSQGAGGIIYPGAIVIFEVQLDSIHADTIP
jgi:hypothetical protein